MTEQTPGTTPIGPTGSEGDSNQLPKEDTLTPRGVDDLLDEGYSPPERPRANHFGETALEQAEGESLEGRLAEEQPEVWEEPDPEAREPDRAGRLAEDPDAAQGKENDVFTVDEGVAGGAATAEEAAVHIVEPDDAAGGTEQEPEAGA